MSTQHLCCALLDRKGHSRWRAGERWPETVADEPALLQSEVHPHAEPGRFFLRSTACSTQTIVILHNDCWLAMIGLNTTLRSGARNIREATAVSPRYGWDFWSSSEFVFEHQWTQSLTAECIECMHSRFQQISENQKIQSGHVET